MDPAALDQVSLNGKVYGAEIWDIVGVELLGHGLQQEDLPKTWASACRRPTTSSRPPADNDQAAGITPIYEPISDGWHHVLWFPDGGPRYEELNPGLADQAERQRDQLGRDQDNEAPCAQQLQGAVSNGCFGDNALSDAYADANKAWRAASMP